MSKKRDELSGVHTIPQTRPVTRLQWPTRLNKWYVALVGMLVVGIVLGVFYAWQINPVTWTHVMYSELEPSDQAAIVELLAENTAFLPDGVTAKRVTNRFPSAGNLACRMAAYEMENGKDNGRIIRLLKLKFELTGSGC